MYLFKTWLFLHLWTFMQNYSLALRLLLYLLFLRFSSSDHSISLAFNHTKENIFCSGELLHYIQMSQIFNDSKYFVDMKLRYDPNLVITKFRMLLNDTNNGPSKVQLEQFLKDNFEPPGVGMKKLVPVDWQDEPPYIDNIYDPKLRNWLIEINGIWKKLDRAIEDDVLNNSNLYSLLYVPYPFIIPGGRFHEFYYWDSFWIVDGLLISGMIETARGMINNYLFMVSKYGFVPNGGRVYYLNRSQPPFLIPMVDLYWKATKDMSFIKENINTLEKEFVFWVKYRCRYIIKDGIKYRVFQYYVNSTNPRPESYYEDFMHANMLNESRKHQFYSSIKSAAETGWDFSSRWFVADGKRTNNILDINTNIIIPVCLNSIMGYNAFILSEMYKALGQKDKFQEYHNILQNINMTISRLFWNESDGIWLDFNSVTNRHQGGFYLSNLLPLWAEMYGMEYERYYVVNRVLEYLQKENVTNFIGGIPSSMQNSGQQWDFPIGWAPLHYFTIFGLKQAGIYNLKATELAFSIAKKWVLNSYFTYRNSSPEVMLEKYDVRSDGIIPGGGGEYVPQVGFGWTNGVVIKLMNTYGDKITLGQNVDPISITVGVALLIVLLFAIINYIYSIDWYFLRNKLCTQLLGNADITEMEQFV